VPAIRLHAAPIDAVDTVTIVSQNQCVAWKTIVADDAYLEGHYPEGTIFPGVFIIESVTQAIRELVRQSVDVGATAQLRTISSVRFTAPLLPGDTLELTCTTRTDDGGNLVVKAVGRNRDAKAAQITATFRIVTDTTEETGV
jgi:3-hydroxyacyl-[acyl-carrier-protein] dehydratase